MTTTPGELDALGRAVRDAGSAAGLVAVGVAPADPFVATRVVLETRRAAGLHGGMAFTYRNPARSTEPGRILDGAQRLVAGAWRYAEPGDAEPVRPAGGAWGRVARVARADHYADLRRALGAVADVLRAAGWRARVVADDNALVDRAAAVRAGLGWFGRNTCVLVPGQGSWLVLGAVVTDAPLPLDPERAVDDGCGSCRRCLAACPSGALVAPGVLDARRCLAWTLQDTADIPDDLLDVLDGRLYGCDDCQAACPLNRPGAAPAASPSSAGGPSGERAAPAPAPSPGGLVDLVDLLGADDESLLERFGAWYVPRRDPSFLRRNALAAMVAAGRADAPGVRGALAAAAVHPSGVVATQARRSAHRLGVALEVP